MIRILLSGACGRLGSAIVRAVSAREDCRIVAGIDPFAKGESAFPIFATPADVTAEADTVIDCSHHSAVLPLLAYCTEKKLPLVICTTGHTDEENAAIDAAAQEIPVLHSRNMSVGINLLLDLVKRAAAVLGEDYDCEIIEQHHNKKLDAPSGTALMLADAVKEVRADSEYVYDRQSVRRERSKNEIGIHSVRGGTIVGEHEVIFAGTDEVIRISHSAYSREVFATGAIRAALFAVTAKAGKYSMKEVLAQVAEEMGE